MVVTIILKTFWLYGFQITKFGIIQLIDIAGYGFLVYFGCCFIGSTFTDATYKW